MRANDERGEVGRRARQERAHHEEGWCRSGRTSSGRRTHHPAGGRDHHGIGGEVKEGSPTRPRRARRHGALQVREHHVGHAGVEDCT
jgi:hypothetical protein